MVFSGDPTTGNDTPAEEEVAASPGPGVIVEQGPRFRYEDLGASAHFRHRVIDSVSGRAFSAANRDHAKAAIEQLNGIIGYEHEVLSQASFDGAARKLRDTADQIAGLLRAGEDAEYLVISKADFDAAVAQMRGEVEVQMTSIEIADMLDSAVGPIDLTDEPEVEPELHPRGVLPAGFLSALEAIREDAQDGSVKKETITLLNLTVEAVKSINDPEARTFVVAGNADEVIDRITQWASEYAGEDAPDDEVLARLLAGHPAGAIESETHNAGA